MDSQHVDRGGLQRVPRNAVRWPLCRLEQRGGCFHNVYGQYGASGPDLLLRGDGSRQQWERERELEPGAGGGADALVSR